MDKGLDISETFTFSEIGQKWLKTKEITVCHSQVVQYKTCLNHLNRYIGDKDIRKLVPNDLQEIIDRFARMNPNTGKPSSHRTLIAIKSTALQVANYAISARLTDFNFAISVFLPKDKTAQKRRALTESERKTILAVEHPCKLSAMIMMYAGLRRGELLALTWNDIDLDNRTISINKSAEIITNQINIKEGAKTKSSVRIVNIPSALSEYLKECKTKAKSNIVCCTPKGTYMSLTTWRRMWQSYINALQEANPLMPDLTSHWLRHPYVKPKTKKYGNIFEAFGAAESLLRPPSGAHSLCLLFRRSYSKEILRYIFDFDPVSRKEVNSLDEPVNQGLRQGIRIA